MTTIQNIISTYINRSLLRLNIDNFEINVDIPKDSKFGDFSTNIAMDLWKDKATREKLLGYNSPLEVAEIIKKNILKDDNENANSCIEDISIIQPGFINFVIKTNFLVSNLRLIINNDTSFYNNSKKEGNILVEYAHPNTHKAFHIGHLRNITTGEAISRILEADGYTVTRLNYQGDVGMHISKAIYGLIITEKQNKFEFNDKDYENFINSWKDREITKKAEYLGQIYAVGSQLFENNKLVQIKIQEINAQIYAAAQKFAHENGLDPGSTDYSKLIFSKTISDDIIYKIWKETRAWSLKYFDSIYERVGTKFDKFFFESQCLAGVDLAKKALEQGILMQSEGAVIFDGSKYGLDKRVFINNLNLPTYEGKELSLCQKEINLVPAIKKIIHIVGPEQKSFFEVTFKVEELMGMQKGIQHHEVYGFVRLKNGKMSSRTGKVILGEWLLDEAKKSLYKYIDDDKNSKTDTEKNYIAEKNAIAAVKYSFLKVNTKSEIAFDFEQSISLEGASGPYILYTYARCNSVLNNSNKEYNLADLYEINEFDRNVLVQLASFKHVIKLAAQNIAPNYIAEYLYKLSKVYNLFYTKNKIIGDINEKLRLQITIATMKVLKAGLELLGITAIDRM